MKNSIPIFLFIVVYFLQQTNSSAQSYNKFLFSSNEWDVYADVIPVSDKSMFPFMSGPVYAIDDTLVGSTLYKKAWSRSEEMSQPGSKPCLIREDTVMRRVYILSADSSNERMLYDFSLITGDSILLEFRYENSPNLVLKSGWYFVDSLGLTNTLSGPRNTWYLSNPLLTLANPTVPHLTWIEGIGSDISPVYLDEEFGYSLGWASPDDIYYLSLVCVFHDSTAVFHDSAWAAIYSQGTWPLFGDSCIFNMAGSVGENKQESAALFIYPNPATDKIFIRLKNCYTSYPNRLLVKIRDITGQEISTEQTATESLVNGIEIQRNGIREGMYCLTICRDGGIIASGKIIFNE